MAGRVILSALLGALVLMAWGFVYWVALPWPSLTLRTLPQEGAVVSTLEQTIPQTGVYVFPRADLTAQAPSAEEEDAMEAPPAPENATMEGEATVEPDTGDEAMQAGSAPDAADEPAGMEAEEGGGVPDPVMATQPDWKLRHMAGPIGRIVYVREGVRPFSELHYLGGFIHYAVAVLLLTLLLVIALPVLPGYWHRVGFMFLGGLFAAFLFSVGRAVWSYYPWGYPLAEFVFHLIGWALVGLVVAWSIDLASRGRRPRRMASGEMRRVGHGPAYLFQPPASPPQ